MIEAKYVTHDQCEAKHGKSRVQIALLTAVVVALIALPAYALAQAWSAAAQVERVQSQTEYVVKTLDEIHTDVREMRATQKEILRNGRVHP